MQRGGSIGKPALLQSAQSSGECALYSCIDSLHAFPDFDIYLFLIVIVCQYVSVISFKFLEEHGRINCNEPQLIISFKNGKFYNANLMAVEHFFLFPSKFNID